VANKASRSSASQQIADALLQVLAEQQDVVLDEHGERVSELAGDLAEALGEPVYEISRIRLAARLHDIGKAAIPAAILDKPGPLDQLNRLFKRLRKRERRDSNPRPPA
jgi:two-component system cell cycle response regulator